MRFRVQLSAAKNYLLGLLTSGLFLVSGLYFFNSSKSPEQPILTFSENSDSEHPSSAKSVITAFNPNDLSEDEWKNLGFSDRQVTTILKYKSVVGGNFSSKEQLKKCYSISAEKYHELEPYILLPDSKAKPSAYTSFESNRYKNSSYSYANQQSRALTIPGKFNPDLYNLNDFINLGFSEKQASSILKYKNYLGGSFLSKEKFKECFVISEENYRKLAPYLLLPESISVNLPAKQSFSGYKQSLEKTEADILPFDPNTTNLEGWKNLGFSDKQAQVIINYRDRNLKGSFKSLDDIARCFVISPEKFEQLKPYIALNSENITSKHSDYLQNGSSVTSQNSSAKSTNNTESKTDFRKTDLNEITFRQLIEFGFDEKSAASYLGFRNKLGGFVNTTQIIDTYNIDKDLAQKLIETSPLFVEKVAKYTLADAPESWLKNHPYFKYYADKIIYYRITYSDEKRFFRTMKIKPEAEQKMRWYLK